MTQMTVIPPMRSGEWSIATALDVAELPLVTFLGAAEQQVSH